MGLMGLSRQSLLFDVVVFISWRVAPKVLQVEITGKRILNKKIVPFSL